MAARRHNAHNNSIDLIIAQCYNIATINASSATVSTTAIASSPPSTVPITPSPPVPPVSGSPVVSPPLAPSPSPLFLLAPPLEPPSPLSLFFLNHRSHIDPPSSGAFGINRASHSPARSHMGSNNFESGFSPVGSRPASGLLSH